MRICCIIKAYIYDAAGRKEALAQVGESKKTGGENRVSVWNWMGTLLVMCVPGVNIVAAILFIILANTQAKRAYAIAFLLVTLLLAALTCAAFLFLPDQLSALADMLRGATLPSM